MSIFSRNTRTADIAPTGRGPVKLVKGSGPANDRSAIESSGAGIDLVKRFDKAGISLSKRGLDGVRAEAVMLLDHSGSMSYDYENGTVQAIVERALGFALQIDGDGTVPVIRFDSGVRKAIDVNLSNYASITSSKLYERNKMGTTNLTAALEELKSIGQQATSPIFAIIVTDGAPNDPTSAERLVRELESLPVFLKFLSIQPVAWLDKLDDMSRQLIDNADAKAIDGTESDLQFADKMTDEWDTWIAAAQQKGILA
ncbi:hypothetical protein SEA_APHELION_117 [Gordonia phage Aphelion]|uniref:VWFA domain-containing protein n=1 Tax=Gordonia phage Aphelion TaxID=2507860 RepID=A0A410TD82_9CAUD|nr:hypothetical protein SEA_APHELION_117 [Gordonia phage Aphelion]WKW85916.1 hypothetical protein SEA_PHINKBODEN_117 [Gordonia Phage PhinkBoden]WNM66388.1 hypothetical protein SEA_CULVER_118 [Gordonia phage Culver]